MGYSAFNTVLLTATIIAPPILVLSIPDGPKFKDLYAIGEYDNCRNAFGVFLVKMMENVPQMVIQQQEMFDGGLRVTAFQAGNILFGSTMLMTSLGWGLGCNIMGLIEGREVKKYLTGLLFTISAIVGLIPKPQKNDVIKQTL